MPTQPPPPPPPIPLTPIYPSSQPLSKNKAKAKSKHLSIALHSPPPRRNLRLPFHPAPRSPYPWLWRCHKCHRIYRFSAVRNRCLSCSHRFCTKCISEIDYDGWDAWGAYWKPPNSAGTKSPDFLDPTLDYDLDVRDSSGSGSGTTSAGLENIPEDDGVDILGGQQWVPATWSLYHSSSSSSSSSSEREEGEIASSHVENKNKNKKKKKRKEKKKKKPVSPIILPPTATQGIPLPGLDRPASGLSQSYDSSLSFQFPSLPDRDQTAALLSSSSPCAQTTAESSWDPVLTYDPEEEQLVPHDRINNHDSMELSPLPPLSPISPCSPPAAPERWLADVSANRGFAERNQERADGKENLPPASSSSPSSGSVESWSRPDDEEEIFVFDAHTSYMYGGGTGSPGATSSYEPLVVGNGGLPLDLDGDVDGDVDADLDGMGLRRC